MISGKQGKIAVVIPCYNEEQRLDVNAFLAFLAANERVHFIYVDDGSKDGTAAMLRRLQARAESSSTVLILPENVGKAEAVRQGILRALQLPDVGIVGFWDADLATPLPIVNRLASIFEDRPAVEMTFGSRVKLLGRDIVRKPIRHYLGRVFATLASLVLRLPVYDTQCGAKLFRASALASDVFASAFISRWIFDVEILARYQSGYAGREGQLHQAIYEYPLEAWQDVAGSKVKGGDFFAASSDLLRIMWHYRRSSWLGGARFVASRKS